MYRKPFPILFCYIFIGWEPNNSEMGVFMFLWHGFFKDFVKITTEIFNLTNFMPIFLVIQDFSMTNIPYKDLKKFDILKYLLHIHKLRLSCFWGAAHLFEICRNMLLYFILLNSMIKRFSHNIYHLSKSILIFYEIFLKWKTRFH